MSANEIVLAIMSVKSIDELKLINDAIGYQWKNVQRANAKQFKVGEQVSFKSKNGLVHFGVIQKVNQKTVTVYTKSMSTWRVSPSILTKVA